VKLFKENCMKVYSAINAIQAELAKEGISKSQKNVQQGYSFRGIDDLFNTLSPLLAKYGLCILPRVLNRICVERQSTRGGLLFYVTLEVEFDFIASEDGSIHTIKTFGEAMDSGDKATNKAMSAAYKYAAFQAFAIPTIGENDADAITHEVTPQKPTLSSEALKHAISWIQSGKGSVEKLQEKYLLSESEKTFLTNATLGDPA
jgi:hypothetical protein